jgi:signal peptidase I
MRDNMKRSVIKEIYEWAETFLIAFSAVILVFTFLIKFVTVSGDSMRETFHNGDRVLITNVAYTPEIGDVVVVDVSHNLEMLHYQQKGAPYIKRVIATEGQTVNIDPVNWKVYVDGKALDEPYVFKINSANMNLGDISYPYTVPEGAVFVMGDNRNGSADSRMIEAIDTRYILGRVFFRLLPNTGVIE